MSKYEVWKGMDRDTWWENSHTQVHTTDQLAAHGLVQDYKPRDKEARAVVYKGPEISGMVPNYEKFGGHNGPFYYPALRQVDGTYSVMHGTCYRQDSVRMCKIYNDAGKEKKKKEEPIEGTHVGTVDGIEYRVGDVVFFEPAGCELGGCLYRVVGGGHHQVHIRPTFQIGRTANDGNVADTYMHPRKVGWDRVKKACLTLLMEEVMRLKIFVNEEIKREARVLKKIQGKSEEGVV